MKSGIIFDIKEFALHDGPGLRQTVFLKGCPLRCNWCHNPEGLSINPELMVSKVSCIACGRCEEVCEKENCDACGACIEICPLRLRKIVGDRITSDELVSAIRKDSDYYASYGGGVTFSGGEPLMQAEFLSETLEKLPDVHKAIETSGYAEETVFKQVIAQIDCVLIDLKIFDDDLHKKHTGVSNQKILKNIRYLCEGEKAFVVRIPLIPGVNDDEKNLRATAEYLKTAPALERIEFLPYHRTAGAKYKMINKKYKPHFDVEQTLSPNTAIFDEYGIRSCVL